MKALVIMPMLLDVEEMDDANEYADTLRNGLIEGVKMEANFHGYDEEEMLEAIQVLNVSVVEVYED